jgi:RepB DNA-primase from phage plasmid
MPTSHAITESHLPPGGTTIHACDADAADDGTAAARTMLDIFSSVGADRFHVTWTNEDGEPRRARSLRKALRAIPGPLPQPENPDWLDEIHIARIGAPDLHRIIPALLETGVADRLNVNLRPYSQTVSFIQLDDIGADALVRCAPVLFLHIETSPAKHQAWLALAGRHDREFARRVIRKCRTDITASGSTKIAGSLNFKAKYAPDYPRVEIRAAHPGRITGTAELHQLGLVAPPEIFKDPSPSGSIFTSRTDKWPSWAMCLDKAPPNSAGTGPDRSRADYWFCFLSQQWGHSEADTADRLMQESPKAREKGKSYALQTARQAARAVERRRQSSIGSR